MARRTKAKSLREAIADSDTDFRRREAKKVVQLARDYCNYSITQNRVEMAVMRLYARYAPARELVSQVVRTDKSNRHYLKHLDRKLCSIKDQEALRQQQ